LYNTYVFLGSCVLADWGVHPLRDHGREFRGLVPQRTITGPPGPPARSATPCCSTEWTTTLTAAATVAKRARKGVVTLLCFEREENSHCHRHLLAKLIEERLQDL